MVQSFDIVVVGAGIAGFSATEVFREHAPSQSVLLVGAEPRLPYKRTKLSKYLAEGFDHDAFALEETRWYRPPLELRTSVFITAIDLTARTATLSDGQTVRWGRLLMATGARAVIPDLPGVDEWFVLRNQDEAARLRQRWAGENDVVILGNGVLGVEIADQARRAGKRVRLWSRSPLPLQRDLTPAASRLLAETLARHGVVQEAPTGEALPWAVAAVGSLPELNLARAAGLATDHGVLVDRSLRTSVPDIWAAGDGTQLPDGTVCHLWHESENQGRTAALSMLGEDVSLPRRAWRLKCEVFDSYWFSMNKPARDPDVEREAFGLYQAFWYDEGRLTGAVMANDKDRNKVYEKAVVEGWSEAQVTRELR